MHNTLPQIAMQLGHVLREKNFKLVVAESCTGGLVSALITSVPGSSQYFECGFVTYSDVSKVAMLGVSETTLQQFGAVSVETASAMAKGALECGNADVSLAITGIAGPSGGSLDKPVGTVCFAWCVPENATQFKIMHFAGDRAKVRDQAVLFALKYLLQLLQNKLM